MRRKSVRWVWAISYIVVLFIPFISLCVNYNTNAVMIKQEIIKANELTLNNISDNVDRFLENLEEYYLFSFGNTTFNEMQLVDEKDSFFYGRSSKYLDALREYTNCCGIDIYYIYYRDDLDFVIASDTANETALYYKQMNLYLPDLVEYEEWKAFLGQRYSENYFVAPNMLGVPRNAIKGIEMPKLLYYANSIYNAGYGKSSVLVGISLEEIAGLTECLDEKISFGMYVDEQPVATFSQGKVIESPIDSEDKNEFSISRQSNKSGISYSLVIPEDYLWNEMAGTRNSFLINVVLTLIFGILGTIFFVRRNYIPLNALVVEMKGDIVQGNEYQEMTQEYRKLKKEMIKSQEVINSQHKELLGNYLLSIMKGRTAPLYIEEANLAFQLNIEGNVALVAFTFPIHAQKDIQLDEMLFFAVDSIWTQLLRGYKLYRVDDGRFLFYLVDLGQTDTEEYITFVTKQAEILCEMMREKWETSVDCVVSDTEIKLDDIRILYQKVMDVFRFQSVLGSLGVIQTCVLENQSESNQLEEYVKSELSDGLNEGNMQRIQSAVERLFAEKNRVPFAVTKMYIIDIFPTVVQIYREYEADRIKQTEIVSYIEKLTKAKEIEELKRSFLSLLEFVYNGIVRKRNKENCSVADKIKEYIMEHYTEKDLNVSTMAEELRRNPKYLSKIFKDETGEGILDYINRVRINKARELFITGNYKVEEVMHMTGYANIVSFRRNFIKILGETPGNYTKKGGVNDF